MTRYDYFRDGSLRKVWWPTTTWPPSIYVEDYYAPNGLKAIAVYGQLQGEGAYLSYYSYDSMNRLESVIHRRSSGWARFAGMEYVSRDEAGNPSEVREYYGGGASDYYTSTYTYDNANRLTGWSLNGTPRGAWAYDQVGNWTMNGWDTDELVDRLDASPTGTFGYHPNGALKQLPASGTPSEAFGYNDQELLSVKTDTQNAWLSLMTWDYAGRRVALSASGGDTWQFIYDPTASAPSVLAEVKNGTVEAFYVREPDGQLLARVAGSARQYYFFDGLGSTQAICPASEGNPTDRYFYTPWGEPDARQQSLTGTSGNPYRYVGQLGYYHHHQDANLSEWMQLGVRFYQPGMGRFERSDPSRREFHSYAYAAGNPTALADPQGLLCGPVNCGYGNFDFGRGLVDACQALYWGLEGFKCDILGYGNPDYYGHADDYGVPACKMAWTGVSLCITLREAEQLLGRCWSYMVAWPRPPMCDRLPPGWTPQWRQCYPARRKVSCPEVPRWPNWFDPDGGEWRWHYPDTYHSLPHWDYNPRCSWNDEWLNVY